MDGLYGELGLTCRESESIRSLIGRVKDYILPYKQRL